MSPNRPTVPAATRPRIQSFAVDGTGARVWQATMQTGARAFWMNQAVSFREALTALAARQTQGRSVFEIPCSKCQTTMRTYSRTAARCPKCGTCHKGEW